MRPILARAMLIGVLMAGSDRGGCSQSEFEAGTRALSDGNYAEAYCRWKPLAERGNADAQYHLGWLYANGNGMAVDIGRALEWWGAATGTWLPGGLPPLRMSPGFTKGW